ncbi:hypothetical protein EP47_13735 [Legionella norrlandica]|uniref:Uncharacterized protein n=1 Tax=Legionella norrlandica TaxID=1498499 RepID=A0A0A2STG2_9GAMM|nr:hypothetical protein [Legionella norrlandica]KGP62744.1 hypothetical protein EP47_13735 [Legionella norrlandica]
MIIGINKETDHFFLAICKIGWHSFLMLGVYDNFQVSHLLCRVGKFFDLSDRTGMEKYLKSYGALCGAIFSGSKAKIKDEGISKKHIGQAPITYQAYDITYEQYCEFVHYLEAIQTEKNRFQCFKPFVQDGNTIHFTQTSARVFPSHSLSPDLYTELHEISTSSTCRHTAINLVKTVTKSPTLPLVSPHFFINLPYKTQLDYGKPSKNIPFYVLPPPPHPLPQIGYSAVDKKKHLIARQLYHRMENLLLIDESTLSTVQKFNSLKNCYLQIIGSQKKQSIDELLLSIQQWKEENKENLQTLRRVYFWDFFIIRESATMQLINKIEEDLKHTKCSY